MLITLLLSFLLDEAVAGNQSTGPAALVTASPAGADDSVPPASEKSGQENGEPPAFTAEQLRQFETHVRPILDEHCL